ncbi:MAG: MFS transporter, partial [Bacteroidota bacterium]
GGIVLQAIGFDGGLATQSEETLLNLRIADIVFPVVTAGLAIWVMWKYSLSEERAKEIKKQLEERRGVL